MKTRILPPLALVVLATSGCATFRSLDAASHGGPLVLGGTRIDVAALRGDRVTTERADVSPPRYPLADLPFSLAMDVALLPFVVPAAVSLAVTGPTRPLTARAAFGGRD